MLWNVDIKDIPYDCAIKQKIAEAEEKTGYLMINWDDYRNFIIDTKVFCEFTSIHKMLGELRR